MTDWLTGFQFRKSHLILGAYKGFADFPICIKIYYGTGTDGTEKVDHLTDYWGDYNTWAGKVYCSSHCKTDFSDLRFTDNYGTTKLNYWIQEKVDGDYAIVWIKVTDDLSTDTTIFVYYGNESASSESDGDGVFLLFDDFDDGIFDTDKWIVSGTYTESGGLLTLAAGGAYIQSKSTWFKEVIVFMKAKFSQADGFIGLCKTTGGTDDAAFFRGEASTIKSRVQRDSNYETGTVGAYQGNFWKFALKWLSEYPETHSSYNSVQFFVDSVGKEWHANNSPNELIPVTNNAIGAGSLIFDWIAVRKVAPAGEEPVHSTWGEEEEIPITHITIGTLACNAIKWSEGQSCDPVIRQVPLSSDGEFVDTGTFVIDNRKLTITIRLTDTQKDTLNNIFNANAIVTITAKTEDASYPRWVYTCWLSEILNEYSYSKEGSNEREWEVELEFYCSSFSYEVSLSP